MELPKLPEDKVENLNSIIARYRSKDGSCFLKDTIYCDFDPREHTEKVDKLINTALRDYKRAGWKLLDKPTRSCSWSDIRFWRLDWQVKTI